MPNITALWVSLKNQHAVYREARMAQILTMASPRDVCGMRWVDIDFGQAVWTVRGKHMSIPLSNPMIDMLTKVQHLSGVSPYVFFDELTGGPLSADFLCFGARDIREAFKNWTTAQQVRVVLEAWAKHVTGAANV